MKTLRILRNASGACGMLTAVCLSQSEDATGKELLIAVIITVISAVLILSPMIEKELTHK